MKKILAAAAVFILVSGAFGAETDVSLKLFGGATWARYSHLPDFFGFGESIRLNDRVGPAAGVGCEIALPFSKSLTSLSSVDYIQKGSYVDWYYIYTRTGSYSFKLEALSLTQLLKIKPFPNLFPYALAGFELSHVLSHSYIISPSNLKIGLMDDTRKTDFGLVAGAGGELSAGRWTSFLELRYHLGLVNLSKGIDVEMTESYPTIKTRAVTLLAGIRYRLGRKGS